MILTITTAVLYPIAITYKKGGLFAPLKVLALLTALIDVLANYTELSLIFGWPKEGDHTITRRIRRMRTDPKEHPSRRNLAELVQVYLDAAEPDGKH